jgi:diaminohydroxyphosphoribosylaminopyrimidine deaminase / 5-amino-6-(5-phosphoribosylamino)uracil reductase
MTDAKRLMAHALALATKGLTLTSPNPRVGCVITNSHGEIIGEGHTQQAGGPHAEIMALRDAASRGASTQGATAYVTLEPCSHQGRTGPCCVALEKAGIRRVVASIADPNPLVAGQGFRWLTDAGIQIDIGLGSEESRELNIGFFSRMVRNKPWVRVKTASSLDGKTALDNGVSQWITGESARADGHAWRARACAILTGIGTVLKDDPTLNVRLHDAQRQPHLAIVDSRLDTPLNARLFAENRTVFIYASIQNAARKAALEAQGAIVICTPSIDGKVNLEAMIRDLAQREINELHVEAGETLNGALIREELVDEFLLYLAPKLLGQGRGLARFGPFQKLDQAVTLDVQGYAPIGVDLRIVARVKGRDKF